MTPIVYVVMDENDGYPLRVFNTPGEAYDYIREIKDMYPETRIDEVPYG